MYFSSRLAMFRPINIIHRIDRTIKQDDSDSRNWRPRENTEREKLYNLNIKFEQDTVASHCPFRGISR